MRTIFSIVAAVVIFCSTASAQEGSMTTDSLRYRGNTYTYHLYRPKNLPENAPLVVMFHGYGSRSKPVSY